MTKKTLKKIVKSITPASPEIKERFEKERKKIEEETEILLEKVSPKEGVIGGFKMDDRGNIIKKEIKRFPSIQPILKDYDDKLKNIRKINEQKLEEFITFKGNIKKIEKIKEENNIPKLEIENDLEPKTSFLKMPKQSKWFSSLDVVEQKALIFEVRELLDKEPFPHTESKHFPLYSFDCYLLWLLNYIFYRKKVYELIPDRNFNLQTLIPKTSLSTPEKRMLRKWFNIQRKYNSNAGWELLFRRPGLVKHIPGLREDIEHQVERIEKRKNKNKYRPEHEEGLSAYTFEKEKKKWKNDTESDDEDFFGKEKKGAFTEYWTTYRDAVCTFYEDKEEDSWDKLSEKEQNNEIERYKKLKKEYTRILKEKYENK